MDGFDDLDFATWWTLSTVLLAMMVIYLLNKNHNLNDEVHRQKEVRKSIKDTMN